jgi:hypothetical protein
VGKGGVGGLLGPVTEELSEQFLLLFEAEIQG